MRIGIALLSLLLAVTAMAQPMRIWIDTDVMIGQFRRDVDDGLALLLALDNDSVEIVGISLVMDVDYGEEVTRKLLNWYAPDKNIPIYKGATSALDSGKVTPASEALIAALQKEPLTLVVLGPATNVATALKHQPTIAKNIATMVFCKGRRPGMVFNPGKGKVAFNDYNFDLDPEAVAAILEYDIDIVLAGYEVASHIYLNRDDIQVFKDKANKGNPWLYRQLKQWQTLWKLFIGTGKQGFMPFDAVTIGPVMAPGFFQKFEDIPVAIVEYENDTKRINKNPEKPYLVVSYDLESDRKVTYYHSVSQGYKAYLLGHLQHITHQKVGK